MDPQQFHMDFDLFFEVFAVVTLLALFIERGLALVFEHRLFVNFFEGKGIKELIAFLVSLWLVVHWDFDAISILLHGDQNFRMGYALTAGVIAGGSKASIKLFHDYMQAMSNAKKEKLALQKLEK